MTESSLETMPWDQHPSIYEHICQHIPAEGPGLNQEGYELPDHEKVNAGKAIRFAPGALDGVFSHHVSGPDEDQQVHEIAAAVIAYCHQPTAANKRAVYELALNEQILGLIDAVLKAIVSEASLDGQRLYELGYSLATESPDREPVKFGIALIGIFDWPPHVEVLQALGRHDEFTLFCAVALTNLTEGSELALWELAKSAKSWGRVQTVERLADTQNPEIKHWLLREGYRNGVLNEYLAYTCAVTGDLLTALAAEVVDQPLLDGAGDLLTALIRGGPAEDMGCYEDGPRATRLFVDQMMAVAQSLEHFHALEEIRNYVRSETAEWDQLVDFGWTEELRQSIAVDCDAILQRPMWVTLTEAELQSDDNGKYFIALSAADSLGIDTWETQVARVRRDAGNGSNWYQLATHATDERIDEVVALAEELLNPNELATGPGLEMGLGLEWQQHNALEYVLQELGKFPGHGRQLLLCGLRSPIIRSRNMVATAMDAWGKPLWGHELTVALERAIAEEPDEDVRDTLEKLAAGEPLDD
ncbi:hypothetical protein AB1L30_05750 [Bremerella sp. JC817]|uniref:hypothetical protein n=1 Tax=Bremerella sp. JC817 TaxID=3231756 RepID=UPI003458EC2C